MTTQMTREQYMADPTEEKHHIYYLQFDNLHVRHLVLVVAGMSELVRAYKEDRHLNTIPLEKWDKAGACINGPTLLHIASINGPVSKADRVCVLKASAKNMVFNEGAIA